MSRNSSDSIEITLEFEAPVTAEDLYVEFSRLADSMETVLDTQDN